MGEQLQSQPAASLEKKNELVSIEPNRKSFSTELSARELNERMNIKSTNRNFHQR